MSQRFDLVVVGAGPAGMAAAVEAKGLGLSVAMIDEQAAPGGQILRGAERHGFAASEAWGPPLLTAFRASGISYIPGAAAWAREGNALLYSRSGRTERLESSTVLIATGSMERPVLVPGHTCPGVFTAGGLQALLKGSAVVPTGRTVFVGSGPLLLLVAQQLARAGVPIAAFLDTIPRGRWRNAVRYGPSLLANPRLGLRGIHLIMARWRSRVPVYSGVHDVQILGDDRVRRISFVSRGHHHEIEADIFALHDGVVPNDHLAVALGCDTRWDPRIRAFSAVRDEAGRSSVAAIWIAGDAATISGGFVASLEGQIAALDIAAQLGRIGVHEQKARSAPLLARRRRERLARRFIEELYAPTLPAPEAEDAALLCRCEEVSLAQARRAIACGADTARKIKAATRCGMGPCQGRQCTLSVIDLLATARGEDPSTIRRPSLRVPSRPISVAELAQCAPARETSVSPDA